jgi:hypothetical protein
MMIVSRLKSSPPYTWLFPPRPLFRDRTAPSEKREVPLARPVGILAGGIMLAGLVITTSAAMRPPGSLSMTDGYASPQRDADFGEDMTVHAVAAVIDRNCAEHAREKLMVGLTNYYLQRRLRPGATSEDAADTSSMTAMLAGPGDPVAMTPATSCQG